MLTCFTVRKRTLSVLVRNQDSTKKKAFKLGCNEFYVVLVIWIESCQEGWKKGVSLFPKCKILGKMHRKRLTPMLDGWNPGRDANHPLVASTSIPGTREHRRDTLPGVLPGGLAVLMHLWAWVPRAANEILGLLFGKSFQKLKQESSAPFTNFILSLLSCSWASSPAHFPESLLVFLKGRVADNGVSPLEHFQALRYS